MMQDVSGVAQIEGDENQFIDEEEQDIDAVTSSDASPTTMSSPDALKRFPKDISTALVEHLRGETLQQLQEKDIQLVERGMNLFFNNQFREAEVLFSSHYLDDCLVASAYGTLGTIRALLSMEQADVDEACQRLLFASRFAQVVSPPEHAVSKTIAVVASSVASVWNKASGLFGGWGNKGKQDPSSPASSSDASPAPPASNTSSGARTIHKHLTAAQFRAEVVHAESEVLRATLLLLQDSFSAYVKAGLALRRSYNAYSRLQRYLIDHKDESSQLDSNSVEGVHFGLGCIHVVTSILPPKVLVILKALGYMHERDVGFNHLSHCLVSNTLRSPLASLFMLAFHGVLPSFALVMTPTSLPVCAMVLAETKKTYTNSVIHLWLEGRIARLSRDIVTSTATLQQCMQHGSNLYTDLPQLQHFALYDAAWNQCCSFDWERAAASFQELEEQSNWSKKMFSYAQGCCFETAAAVCALYASSVAAHQEVAVGVAVNGFFDGLDREAAALRCQEFLLKATSAYQRSHDYQSTRLGGKVISVDQFSSRRLTSMIARKAETASPYIKNLVPLSAFELLMVFNMLWQAPPVALKCMSRAVRLIGQAVSDRDSAIPQHMCQSLLSACSDEDVVSAGDLPLASLWLFPSYKGESVVLIQLLADCTRDSTDSEMGLQAAERLYSTLLDPKFCDTTRSEELKWIGPMAMYNRAICRYWTAMRDPAGTPNEILALELNTLRNTYNRVDYHFEMQMQFRVHLTNDYLRHQIAAAVAVAASSST